MALKASTSKGDILTPQHEYERLDLGDFFSWDDEGQE